MSFRRKRWELWWRVGFAGVEAWCYLSKLRPLWWMYLPTHTPTHQSEHPPKVSANGSEGHLGDHFPPPSTTFNPLDSKPCIQPTNDPKFVQLVLFNCPKEGKFNSTSFSFFRSLFIILHSLYCGRKFNLYSLKSLLHLQPLSINVYDKRVPQTSECTT
jgi:hypothetical protein